MTPLQKNDIVDIIAPGFGAKPQHVDAAKQYLKSLGLRPRVSPDLLGDDMLSANSYAHRLNVTRTALEARDSQAVWAIKGGYGTSEIIPDMLDLNLPRQPKWLIGFSDITALHNLLHRYHHWPTLHAPVLWQITQNKVDTESITATEDVLFGRVNELRYELAPLNYSLLETPSGTNIEISNERSMREPLVAEGLSPIAQGSSPKQGETQKLLGGNMMLLQSSIGTCWEPKLDGAILFLEDIDESAYRVARVLHHLQQAGWFTRAAAVIFGDFNFIDRKDDTVKTDLVIHQFSEQLTIPAYRIAGVGHTNTNMPLLLNGEATIDDTKLTLTI